MILITGAIAVWIVTCKTEWRLWGCIIGLMGQPFWLWATWESQQWGMFVLSVWYTYSWLHGTYIAMQIRKNAGPMRYRRNR